MTTTIKETKTARPKPTTAQPLAEANSTATNDLVFPPAGLNQRISEHKEILIRELTQRGIETGPLACFIDPQNSMLEKISNEIAKTIITTIAQTAEGALPTLKKAIARASHLNGEQLLSGRSFNGRTEADLRSTPLEAWRERIYGEISTRIVLGVTAEKQLKEVLGRIVCSDAYHELLAGCEGYVWVSDIFGQGRMQKGYMLMSALCKYSGIKFDDFGWDAQFPGTTKQLGDLLAELENTATHATYSGLDGYKLFSTKFANNDMLKGHILMSALCKYSGIKFDDFGWDAQFPGTTKQLGDLLAELENTATHATYSGLDGYKLFSTKFANNDMLKGYMLMSALCKFTTELEFRDFSWPPPFNGTIQQHEYIQESINYLGERLNYLKDMSKEGRLVALRELLVRLSDGEVIADLPLTALYAGLPERISDLYRSDFSTACLRLTVTNGDEVQAVYFDSNPERICGYLLHKYGLIDTFIEGENLHVRPTSASRVSLDFKVMGQNNDVVFIEYHPLSRRDLEDGLSIEDAGRRKKDSVKGGQFHDATVHHIWELEELFTVLQTCQMKTPPQSFAEFQSDIREAKALGRRLDQEDAQQLEGALVRLGLRTHDKLTLSSGAERHTAPTLL